MGTSNTIRVIGKLLPPTDHEIDDSDQVFGAHDDGYDELRVSLLIWRVAARLATRNRELSQNLEYRAQQAERELYVLLDSAGVAETPTSGTVRVNDV